MVVLLVVWVYHVPMPFPYPLEGSGHPQMPPAIMRGTVRKGRGRRKRVGYDNTSMKFKLVQVGDRRYLGHFIMLRCIECICSGWNVFLAAIGTSLRRVTDATEKIPTSALAHQRHADELKVEFMKYLFHVNKVKTLFITFWWTFVGKAIGLLSHKHIFGMKRKYTQIQKRRCHHTAVSHFTWTR